MPKVEDCLVVLEDGGLGEELFGEDIAWEDFILEEPGTTRALVQANLTTR